MLAQVVISPDLEARLKYIQELIIKIGLNQQHPDLLYYDQAQKVGIEQSRKIKEFFSYKPYQAKGRGAVIENAEALSPEAQNALLKTIEELPETGLLILGVSSQESLLPTVISRCQIVMLKSLPHAEDRQSASYQDDIEKLINSTIAERFSYIEKLKDKELFFQSLILYFRNQLLQTAKLENTAIQKNQVKQYKDFLTEALAAEKIIKSNVNIRAVLEYLMLVMP